MQTFLPYADFEMSAFVLDRQRLGNQRKETWQIMRALFTGQGWSNHPATLMWRRYEWSLLQYQEAICKEWVKRGYTDNMLLRTQQLYYEKCEWTESYLKPNWLGDLRFHASHQSLLKRKDPDYYTPYFPYVSNSLEVIYPRAEPPYKRFRTSEPAKIYVGACTPCDVAIFGGPECPEHRD